MTREEKLKLDYEATTKYLHQLADARFKLLAFVPTVTGLALANYDKFERPGLALAVGIFGFIVTLGISYYDQRNTAIYDAMQIRAKTLEAYLGFPISQNYSELQKNFPKRSGAILDRPARGLFWFRLKIEPFKIWHDRGLALVYGSAVGAWAYIALAPLGKLSPWPWLFWAGPIGGFALGIAVLIQYHMNDSPTDEAEALRPEVQILLLRDP